MIAKHQRGERTSYTVSSRERPTPGEFADERTARYALQFCTHQLEMLTATVNRGEARLITSVDLRRYARLCHRCEAS